jgi:hypothetical protein
MKVLIRNSDNVVLFADATLVLTDKGVTTDNRRYDGLNSSTAHLLDVTLPAVFAPGMYSYDGTTITIVDQALYDTVAAQVAADAAAAAAAAAQVQADLSAKDYAKAQPVIAYLVNHTPSECEAYVAANVTNLATAINMLQKFAVALCVLSKKEFR